MKIMIRLLCQYKRSNPEILSLSFCTIWAVHDPLVAGSGWEQCLS